MISACAASSLHTSSLRFLPFVPPLETHPSLISHPTPLSSPLLVRSHRSAPRPSRPFRPSFFPSSPVVLLVCPSLVCVSLSLPSTFPLFLLGGLGFYPCFAPSLIKRLCLSLSLLLSPACRSVSPPFDTRRSLFARVTHRRGETIRRFPGWHLVSRAAFFPLYLPVSFPCRLSSQKPLLLLTGRKAYDRWVVTRRRKGKNDFRSDRCHCQWRGS